MGDLLPTPLKWRVFFASEDGALDLGTQRTVVRDAAT
jgi:hypothetical protein